MSETLDAPALLIENGRVVDPCQGIDRVARVLVQGEVIAAIDPSDGDLPPNCEVVDAAGCIVAPGLVDLEVEVAQGVIEIFTQGEDLVAIELFEGAL